MTHLAKQMRMLVARGNCLQGLQATPGCHLVAPRTNWVSISEHLEHTIVLGTLVGKYCLKSLLAGLFYSLQLKACHYLADKF